MGESLMKAKVIGSLEFCEFQISVSGKQQIILDLWVFYYTALLNTCLKSCSEIERLTIDWSNSTKSLFIVDENGLKLFYETRLQILR